MLELLEPWLSVSEFLDGVVPFVILVCQLIPDCPHHGCLHYVNLFYLQLCHFALVFVCFYFTAGQGVCAGF